MEDSLGLSQSAAASNMGQAFRQGELARGLAPSEQRIAFADLQDANDMPAPVQIHKDNRDSDFVFSQIEDLAANIPDAEAEVSFPPAITKATFEADMLASLRKRQVPIPQVENLDLHASEAQN